ncbi:hypothetical protein RB195_002008 [Necator americanus]|uniref:Uncharacterized protein n=1 Tax=Necator americanus TaxID=51031 RepID=A0ABR1DH96_NECAM
MLQKLLSLEQGGLAIAGRPPTRHGRESVSSSEENRDQSSTSSELRKEDEAEKSDLLQAYDTGEDEFLAKL